ncbi:Lrp/AsnC family transcriptional regulator [Pseudooceanicola onchidii]|uniref:Lrp/AsnC family transcriptional regulator n=1 Tax=Pseudooceanicola onchidii TaxID=2562279 RepID=UPI0010AAC1E6|nr:Lrp/AsnC family transcriptional regulator [Pseudooceanicola onchidii]
MPLDKIDLSILREVQQNARISMTELARRVGLSKTPVTQRVQAMEKSGVIAAYRAVLSPRKLGLSHVTYMEVRLLDTTEAALRRFNDAVRQIAEVEECYMIAGNFDYLLKVRSRDITHFRTIMGDQISALPGVASTSSFVAMEAVIENAEIEV